MTEHPAQMSEAYSLGALLTVGGGFLDAYTYFTRGGVFSNAQTGNLVLLAIRLAQGDLTALPHYLPPILSGVHGHARHPAGGQRKGAGVRREGGAGPGLLHHPGEPL